MKTYKDLSREEKKEVELYINFSSYQEQGYGSLLSAIFIIATLGCILLSFPYSFFQAIGFFILMSCILVLLYVLYLIERMKKIRFLVFGKDKLKEFFDVSDSDLNRVRKAWKKE